jgi:hypothetical protein
MVKLREIGKVGRIGKMREIRRLLIFARKVHVCNQ